MIVKAIQNLIPNAKFSISGNFTYEDIIWQDERPIPNKEEVELETQKAQAEHDAKKYQRDRLAEYPSIQELVVALYDEEDKASIIERRNAVKAKYPKPE